MKRLSYLTAFLLSFLLCASFALANDYTSITDEIEVDFATSKVRAYAVVKKASDDYFGRAKSQARKALLAYIGTLTTGKERTPLKDVFSKRPTLYAKVQHVVEEKLQNGAYQDLPETGQLSHYYYFDLKFLQPLLPELNFPSKDDTL